MSTSFFTTKIKNHRLLIQAFFLSFDLISNPLRQNSRRPLSTPEKTEAPTFTLASTWNEVGHGSITTVDIVPGIVAVGTDKGGVQIFTYGGGRHILRQYLIIPSPPTNDMAVVACKISATKEKASVFVAYRRRTTVRSDGGNGPVSSPRSTAGVSADPREPRTKSSGAVRVAPG